MSDPMTPEVKPLPCPFCGVAMIASDGVASDPSRIAVKHPPTDTNDGCHLAAYYRLQYVANLEQWNRRADGAASSVPAPADDFNNVRDGDKWLFARRCVQAGFDYASELERAADRCDDNQPGYEEISANIDAKAAHIAKHQWPAGLPFSGESPDTIAGQCPTCGHVDETRTAMKP